MAIQSISAIQRYIGLSTDTMPTAGVGSGAEFLQTDTGAIYIYTGSSWVIHTPAVQVSGSITLQEYLQGSASAGASATGQGVAATMAVPFSVDFTVQGSSPTGLVITPQVFDAAGNAVTNAPGSQLYQMDNYLVKVSSITTTGGWYHIELPGGWQFYADITGLTGGTITIPATLEAI